MDPDTKEHLDALSARIAKLEEQVTRLVTILEQGTGAWVIIRWLGALIISISGLWALFTDHLHK